MKGSVHLSPPAVVATSTTPKNWMDWKKMEIARTPVGEKMARRGATGCPPTYKNSSIIRRNTACATFLFTYLSMKETKQDSSFSYFVFLWLHPPQRGCH